MSNPSQDVRQPKVGKPSKLTPQLRDQLCEALRIGTTVENACDYVGIAPSTYYNWMAVGRACASGIDHALKPEFIEDQTSFLEFLEAVTRALAAAQFSAVAALRNGMVAATTEEETVETFSEVRLRQSASGEQIPYTYTRTKRTSKTIHHPADWRAAESYLKRRHPREWSDRVTLDDDRSLAIRDIRAGTLAFEALLEVGGYEFAAGLYQEAGVPVPAEAGTDE